MWIAELWRYPVKSMAGERLDTARLGLDGIPGDRGIVVLDGEGDIVSARTAPRLLQHHATLVDGEVLVDGLPWDSPEVATLVRAAAGEDATLVEATSPLRFDILPLLVATDGAITSFGHDRRRLRPNIVIGGVEGLAERGWEYSAFRAGEAVIAMATLRGRCIVTTYDPDSGEQDVDVLRGIRARFGGTLALNAWAGVPGTVAVGDAVEPLEARIELARPASGRFVG
jgi:uncharacterized protein YcbX